MICLIGTSAVSDWCGDGVSAQENLDGILSLGIQIKTPSEDLLP